VEEIEVPVEKMQEALMENAGEGPAWFGWVALSSALLAVIAAVAALLAGHHANEALLEQIQSSDRWSYYQAKGIKAAVLSSKMQLLQELGKKIPDEDREKQSQYKDDQEEISKEAKEKEEVSRHHMLTHSSFATAVTFFQVAIAVSAISVLVRRRRFWLVSLVFGAFGLGYFILGFMGPLSGFH